MKVEVIEKRANQVRDIKCPVCSKEATIVIEEGRTEGSLHCWFCSSLLGWDISDEVKPVEEQAEVLDNFIKKSTKRMKKDVKPEETA